MLKITSHRDLEGMITRREFRQDLYYPLNVFPIQIPPLRERANDIPALVRHFIDRTAQRMNKTIDSVPTETMAALTHSLGQEISANWRTFIERTVIL